MSLGSFIDPTLIESGIKVDPVTEGRSLGDNALARVEDVTQRVDVLEVSHDVELIQHPVQAAVLTQRILGKLLLVVTFDPLVLDLVVQLLNQLRNETYYGTSL